jgi:DnaJ-class molecular chaperone
MPGDMPSTASADDLLAQLVRQRDAAVQRKAAALCPACQGWGCSKGRKCYPQVCPCCKACGGTGVAPDRKADALALIARLTAGDRPKE